MDGWCFLAKRNDEVLKYAVGARDEAAARRLLCKRLEIDTESVEVVGPLTNDELGRYGTVPGRIARITPNGNIRSK